MTTTQTNVMEQQMQNQHKVMYDQQQKFMEMMISKMGQQNNGGGNNNNNNRNVNCNNGTNNNQNESPFPECPHCHEKGKHTLNPDSCRMKNRDGV